MNPTIFRDIFDSDSVVHAMIATSESEDDLGCILRLHLISETYLEAYISSALEHPELFSDTPPDGVSLQMNYASKAQLAFKLGLHINAYKALVLINKVRNKAAHRINNELITSDLLNNLKNYAHNIGIRSPNELNGHGAKFYNDDETLRVSYPFSSEQTPNRVKLMIILSAIFTWAAEDANILVTSPV